MVIETDEAEMKDRHQTTSYPLRIPGALRAALALSAAANRRSLNSEILVILEQAVRQVQPQLSGAKP